MNIAKILQIEPNGNPFTNAHGTMYPWIVTFDDQMSGEANTKSQQPAYRVGDVVGYEQTGSSPRGTPKLKIDRNAAQNAPQGSYRPGPAKSPRSSQSDYTAPAAQLLTIPGQTVGMAMKEAIGLSISAFRNTSTEAPDIGSPEFWEMVHIAASDIIRVSQMLERGHLAPSAKARATPQPARTPVPPPRQRQPEPYAPANQEQLDEDVPF